MDLIEYDRDASIIMKRTSFVSKFTDHYNSAHTIFDIENFIISSTCGFQSNNIKSNVLKKIFHRITNL